MCVHGAVADLYVGIRPEVPDGRFDADFTLCRLSDTHLGFLSTPGVPATRDRRALRQLPDDAVFVNFSRACWTLDHVTGDAVRRADETVTSSESGRHLATQMSLLATMIDTAAIETASLMAPVVVDLVRSLLHPGDQAAPTRLARLMDISQGRLTDPGFDLAALARESRWSVRTVQAAFSAEGLSFSDWLTGERLELARTMLTDPVWASSRSAPSMCFQVAVSRRAASPQESAGRDRGNVARKKLTGKTALSGMQANSRPAGHRRQPGNLARVTPGAGWT